MKRARNISMFVRFGMAMIVALAPLSVAAADKPAEAPPPTAADFARLQKRGSGAAAAHHPDDAGRAAALRHVAQAAAVGRAAFGHRVASSPPGPGNGGPAATPSAPAATGGAKSGGGGERVASVTGRVEARAGSLKEAYVYVDIAKGSSARGHTLEIKQKDKQFWPQTAVVQRGTSIVFPNLDSVFHSVFSTSGRNSFDLGSYRSGDPARSVTLTTPGVVEVFCNIHAKMNANILVVPGPLLHQGRRRRQLPHRERPGRVTPHRGLESQRQARPAEGRRRIGRRAGELHARHRGREGPHEQAGATLRVLQGIVSTAWPRATIRHDIRSQDSVADLRGRCAGCRRRGGHCAPRAELRVQRRRAEKPARSGGHARDDPEGARGPAARPGDRGQGRGGDPAAEGGAGRRRRCGHDPRPVRE